MMGLIYTAFEILLAVAVFVTWVVALRSWLRLPRHEREKAAEELHNSGDW